MQLSPAGCSLAHTGAQTMHPTAAVSSLGHSRVRSGFPSAASVAVVLKADWANTTRILRSTHRTLGWFTRDQVPRTRSRLLLCGRTVLLEVSRPSGGTACWGRQRTKHDSGTAVGCRGEGEEMHRFSRFCVARLLPGRGLPLLPGSGLPLRLPGPILLQGLQVSAPPPLSLLEVPLRQTSGGVTACGGLHESPQHLPRIRILVALHRSGVPPYSSVLVRIRRRTTAAVPLRGAQHPGHTMMPPRQAASPQVRRHHGPGALPGSC